MFVLWLVTHYLMFYRGWNPIELFSVVVCCPISKYMMTREFFDCVLSSFINAQVFSDLQNKTQFSEVSSHDLKCDKRRI